MSKLSLIFDYRIAKVFCRHWILCRLTPDKLLTKAVPVRTAISGLRCRLSQQRLCICKKQVFTNVTKNRSNIHQTTCLGF